VRGYFGIGEVGDVFDHDLLGILVMRGEGWVEEGAVSRSRQCPCRRCHWDCPVGDRCWRGLAVGELSSWFEP
jgi:hypothetical protein